MPFNIEPLLNEKQIITGLNPSIPQPQNGNFRLAIIGQSGSGKSVLLLNLLKAYRTYYEKIVVFTPNVSQFKLNFGPIMTTHDVLYEKYSQKEVKKHFNKSMKRNRSNKKRKPMIMVFDDALDMIQKDPFFKRMMLISRKEEVSLIFTTHKFTFVKPLIRQNLSNIVILSTTPMELNLVSRYIGTDSKSLQEAWKRAEGLYQFLYIILNPLTVILNFSDIVLLT